jgi:translation initiation factor IF-3
MLDVVYYHARLFSFKIVVHGFFIYFWVCLPISKKTLINEEIKASEVRVVDAEGKQLGILKIEQALKLAYAEQLDLVEIAPDAKPPVAKSWITANIALKRKSAKKRLKRSSRLSS